MKAKVMYRNKHERNNMFFTLNQILTADKKQFLSDIREGQYNDDVESEMATKNCDHETAVKNILDSMLENDIITDDFEQVIVDESKTNVLCDEFEDDGTPIYPADSEIKKADDNDTLEIVDLTVEE